MWHSSHFFRHTLTSVFVTVPPRASPGIVLPLSEHELPQLPEVKRQLMIRQDKPLPKRNNILFYGKSPSPAGPPRAPNFSINALFTVL